MARLDHDGTTRFEDYNNNYNYCAVCGHTTETKRPIYVFIYVYVYTLKIYITLITVVYNCCVGSKSHDESCIFHNPALYNIVLQIAVFLSPIGLRIRLYARLETTPQITALHNTRPRQIHYNDVRTCKRRIRTSRRDFYAKTIFVVLLRASYLACPLFVLFYAYDVS